jgi:predicted MFS family arabinose efflux permease
MQEASARLDVRGAIDWRLLGPLLVHVVLVNTAFGILRVTTSYRTIELGLPAFWLGAISASFAILPIFLAVTIGRFIDRGHDAHAAWVGSGLMLLASCLLWAWPLSAGHLLAFMVLLGTGHMFLMASQQMLTVRCATPQQRETAFGHFMVAISFGQGLGPFIVGWIGGHATVPATGPLFLIGMAMAAACCVVAFTVLLGTGHMFLMASQQMLTVRCATPQQRETAFGHFMVAISFGQGLGPFIVGWVGGHATVPATGPLFLIGMAMAAACCAVACTIRPAPRAARHASNGKTVPIATLLRLPGMFAVLLASVVTVTAGDLLVIYLPLLGAERNIDATHVGMLLLTRSIAGLIVRLFYARLVFEVGRLRLTLVSTFAAAAAFLLLMVPLLPVMYVATVAIGAGLAIASTLTISGIVAVAPPEARGTAMTLRITGNRMGLMIMPFAAGLVAVATGAVGILAIVALTLTGSAVAMQRSGGRDESTAL